MGIEGELPTPEQVVYIRNEIIKYVEENGQGKVSSLSHFVCLEGIITLRNVTNIHNVSDIFDPRDVQRLLNDKAYVERFFMHMFDLPGLQEDNAVTMVINAFKWRKENKVRGECPFIKPPYVLS